MNFMFWFLYVLLFVMCLFMILMILIQKGRGGGLSSAFSGGGGGNTAFGSKTGDVLTWATSIAFGIFMLLAIGLNLVANAREHQKFPAKQGTNVTTPATPDSSD
jgi:preprotein translocase subunit SecG